MKPLAPDWGRIQRKLDPKKKLFLLDFDGTLVAIRRSPSEVCVPKRVRRELARLASEPSCVVAVISGRSIKDLSSHLRLKRAIFMGNHGLQIKGDGLRPFAKARKARQFVPALALLARKLEAAFDFLPGVFVENKGLTLSLHYRNLPKEREIFFKALLGHFREKYGSFPFLWRKGKKVVEICPDVGWDKGMAAQSLVRQFPGFFPVVFGDDSTDEDMFRALKGKALTVRVGRSKRSAAEFYVNNHKDVARFLKRIGTHGA